MIMKVVNREIVKLSFRLILEKMWFLYGDVLNFM